MERAKKQDGLKDFPEKYTSFSLNKELTNKEYELLERGFIPSQQEDKWYIYVEDTDYLSKEIEGKQILLTTTWIYFHRSWTGHVCYKTKIEKSATGYLLTETRINDYSPPSSITLSNFSMTNFPNDIDFAKTLVPYLVDRILLRKNILFPKVEEFSAEENFGYRWHLVGRASNNHPKD